MRKVAIVEGCGADRVFEVPATLALLRHKQKRTIFVPFALRPVRVTHFCLDACMLRVTRMADYATLLLSVLALAPRDVHSATALAERTRLELTTVSKVLKLLAQGGLVQGYRGASGGYCLARDPGEVSLFEIVEAIEGPIGMTECSGGHSRCEYQPWCGIAPHWRQVNDIVADALRGVTLAQMLGPSAALASRRPSPASVAE